MCAYPRILPTSCRKDPTHVQNHGVVWSDPQLRRDVSCRVQLHLGRVQARIQQMSSRTMRNEALNRDLQREEQCVLWNRMT